MRKIYRETVRLVELKLMNNEVDLRALRGPPSY